MARDVADYVALALIRNEHADDAFFGRSTDFSGDIEELKTRVGEVCGFPVSDDIISRALRTISDCGLLRVTDDAYSGIFYKIKSSELDKFFARLDAELEAARKEGDDLGLVTRPSDYPAANALIKHELIEDYRELGSEWLSRALAGLQKTVGPEGLVNTSSRADAQNGGGPVPAADRVVTLRHNQQKELEEVSTILIEAVDKENALDGDSSLRQLVLGQLRAGRELIRAQTLNAYLLYQTLVSTLGKLIDRYKGHAIGITAAKLLELLIEHIFGK
jgi:hypothetical protein